MLKKKIKVLSFAFVLAVLMLMLSGCGGFHSSKSYTFNVSSGDSVEVTLDTTNSQLDLKLADGAFYVLKDGTPITQCFFVESDYYTEYEEKARIKENFKHNIIRENRGFYYEDDESGQHEYIYMTRLNSSNTAVAMSTITSEEDATEVAASLIYTIVVE